MKRRTGLRDGFRKRPLARWRQRRCVDDDAPNDEVGAEALALRLNCPHDFEAFSVATCDRLARCEEKTLGDKLTEVRTTVLVDEPKAMHLAEQTIGPPRKMRRRARHSRKLRRFSSASAGLPFIHSSGRYLRSAGLDPRSDGRGIRERDR